MLLSACFPATAGRRLILCCAVDNDLYRVVSENGMAVRRVDAPQAAIEAAAEGDGVLVLADGYPTRLTPID